MGSLSERLPAARAGKRRRDRGPRGAPGPLRQGREPRARTRVRKTSAAAPKEAKPTKIAAVIEKAKTVGITMAEVKAMTGWSKTGGFYGAIKRAGLTLTKDAGGVYHAA